MNLPRFFSRNRRKERTREKGYKKGDWGLGFCNIIPEGAKKGATAHGWSSHCERGGGGNPDKNIKTSKGVISR